MTPSRSKLALLESMLAQLDAISPREAQAHVHFLAEHVQQRLLEERVVVFGDEPSQTIARVP